MTATKYDSNKAQATIAKHCEKAMLAVHKAETTLFSRMVSAWDELNDGTMSIPDFRKEFKSYGIATGYSERWIAECLTEAGFRVRAERSDNGKARKAGKSNLDKAIEAANALTAAELKALVKFLASK